MFTLERDHHTTIRDQLVQQLRYYIASGTYSLNETLPSTRELAEQTGTSFHTIRKAYQELQQQGLVESQQGSGYVVISRGTLSKRDRIEQGASVVQDAVQKLIGLGLSEQEMEYLYQEQLAVLTLDRPTFKLLMVAPFFELSDRCAEILSKKLQKTVHPASFDDLSTHADVDLVFCVYPLLRQVQSAVPRADVVGITPQIQGAALDRIARMLDHETLGLIVRNKSTIPHLSAWLKRETGFQGQLMASSVDAIGDTIQQYKRSTDYIACMADVEPKLQRQLDSDIRYDVLDFYIPDASLDAAQKSMPGR